MIIESVVLLSLVLLMGLFFNRRIKQMTPSRPLHHQKRRVNRHPSREINPPQATVHHLEPLDSHSLRKDYVDKISRSDPKAVAAMISHWTKYKED